MGDPSDRDLLDLCARGDRRAFDTIVGRHGRAVLAYARSRSFDRDDADDIAQEAFVLLWERRSRVSLATDSALPWLLVTVRLKAMDRAKTAARRRTSPIETVDLLAAHGDEPPEAVERERLAAAVAGVVAALPALDQELLRRCLVEGERYEDAAAALGLTHAAVRGRLARLRQRLRGDLAGFREGDE